MEGLRTNLLPYYLSCTTCKQEEWVEESNWLKATVKHMEGSKEEHTRTVQQKEAVLVWEGKEHEGRKYRNLSIS
jgi:hypothetical protein|tara:strand:- start:162 stop:383 length:222 start_codon:yes stop_codon:yes gene_type:complete